MQEMWVPSLGQEDPLEEEITTHSSILAWKTLRQGSLAVYSSRGDKESDTNEHSTSQMDLRLELETQ